MKKRLQGFIVGIMTAVLLTCGISYAAGENVRIFLDGKEIIAKDAAGSRVYPIIVDGTTYLPVRAVANAFGKEVYWDGPNYTVYLGDMGGTLGYASAELGDVDNIGRELSNVDSNKLTDNYGNSYGQAQYMFWNKGNFETLLNMKYSRFKCTLYVPKGCTSDDIAKILIKADGKTIYTSPEITKTSAPVDVDVNITGCNDFQIEFEGNHRNLSYIADAGFYQ